MAKRRCGGYVFVRWVGDHGPRHVHVYRDGTLIVKWDAENWRPMKGKANHAVRRLLERLRREQWL